MKIIDISITTTPKTVTWDGSERGFSSEFLCAITPDIPCNVSLLTVGAHTGTHLDAPLHFIAGGGTVDGLDPNVLVGPVQVLDLIGRSQIHAADFEAADVRPGIERVLLRTDNTKQRLVHDARFHEDYVGVAPDGAQWLVDHGIKLVGVDYLSIGPYGPLNVETHRILLGAALVIVETLDLTDAAPGFYTLAALPPKFGGIEGCPCRAILMEGLAQ